MFINIKRGGNTVCTSHASCHSLLMFAPSPLEADSSKQERAAADFDTSLVRPKSYCQNVKIRAT